MATEVIIIMLIIIHSNSIYGASEHDFLLRDVPGQAKNSRLTIRTRNVVTVNGHRDSNNNGWVKF